MNDEAARKAARHDPRQEIGPYESIRPLAAGATTHFMFGGERRDLRQPEGRPTARQLLRLNDLGALALVEPGQVITKGAAAGALDVLLAAEPGVAA
jgi:hypothetical protein